MHITICLSHSNHTKIIKWALGIWMSDFTFKTGCKMLLGIYTKKWRFFHVKQRLSLLIEGKLKSVTILQFHALHHNNQITELQNQAAFSTTWTQNMFARAFDVRNQSNNTHSFLHSLAVKVCGSFAVLNSFSLSKKIGCFIEPKNAWPLVI